MNLNLNVALNQLLEHTRDISLKHCISLGHLVFEFEFVFEIKLDI